MPTPQPCIILVGDFHLLNGWKHRPSPHGKVKNRNRHLPAQSIPQIDHKILQERVRRFKEGSRQQVKELKSAAQTLLA
jgi:hypothetical protein